VVGGNVSIDDSVIRDTAPGAVNPGLGVLASDDSVTGLRAMVTVTGSLVERNRNTGIGAQGAVVTVVRTVVRETKPRADGMTGRGIDAHENGTTKAHAELTVRGSFVADSYDAGIVIVG